MMEKNGMLTTKSVSDFSTKKAAYYDAEGYAVADEANKHKLAKPVRIKEPKNTEDNLSVDKTLSNVTLSLRGGNFKDSENQTDIKDRKINEAHGNFHVQ